MKPRLCLVILDGWGIRGESEGNAILAAKTPNYERLWHGNPHAVLEASGEAMGLPKGQMGTSEIGHLTIGAGRIIFQDLPKISQAIKSGEFFRNQSLIKLMSRVKKQHKILHLFGLVSNGGVHSHEHHLYALIKMAKDLGLTKVLVHAFTDGRDCPPRSGLGFIEDLEKQVKIASVAGRYYAMDRDHNWERTEKVYRLLTYGRPGQKTASEIVKQSYAQKITDEFVRPARTKFFRPVKAGDGAIFFNFRNDRPRQLLERFLTKGPKLDWLTLTRYKPDYPVAVAFPPEELKQSLGEVISRAGLKQLRLTETEKFAHLTFFLNCKREEAFEGEDRIMIDSYSDIATHDEKPQMRAREITQEILQAMGKKTHEVIMANLCNADMVGHSGNFPAIVKAVETIDECLGRLSEAAKANHYDLLITADHGNAEEPTTYHSTNPVPLIIQSDRVAQVKNDEGGLVDIAPTVLALLDLPVPPVMTGRSLV